MSLEYFYCFVLEAILDKAVEAGAVLTLKEYLALNNNDTSVTEVALLCLNAIQDTSNPTPSLSFPDFFTLDFLKWRRFYSFRSDSNEGSRSGLDSIAPVAK